LYNTLFIGGLHLIEKADFFHLILFSDTDEKRYVCRGSADHNLLKRIVSLLVSTGQSKTTLARSVYASEVERSRITDAHRDGKRFVVRADEKLTAFVELERAIHDFAVSLVS
jgi:hypothetical protein